MRPSFRVQGSRELIKQIGRSELQLRGAVVELVEKYALLIAGTAKKNLDRTGLPGVDYGRLRASIRHALSQAALYADVFTDVEYAVYVHEGTGEHATGGDGRDTPWVYFDERRRQFVTTTGMRANPFLYDAFSEHAPDFMRELQGLIRAMGRAAGRRGRR